MNWMSCGQMGESGELIQNNQIYLSAWVNCLMKD